MTTQKGSLVAVSLPARPAGTALVWRVARPVDTRVVRQVGEADLGPAVVLVFRVVGAGRTSLHFALDARRRIPGGASSGSVRHPGDLTARLPV